MTSFGLDTGVASCRSTIIKPQYYALLDVRAYRMLFWKLVGLGAVIGAVMFLRDAVARREILSMLCVPGYVLYVKMFMMLILVAPVSYSASFLGYGIAAARKFRAQLQLFAVANIVIISGCILLKEFGLIGVPGAMLVSSMVQIAGSILIIKDALWEAI